MALAKHNDFIFFLGLVKEASRLSAPELSPGWLRSLAPGPAVCSEQAIPMSREDRLADVLVSFEGGVKYGFLCWKQT